MPTDQQAAGGEHSNVQTLGRDIDAHKGLEIS